MLLANPVRNPMDMARMAEFHRQGFVVIENMVSSSDLKKILAAFNARGGSIGAGMRRPHVEIDEIAALVGSTKVRNLIQSILGKGTRVVRSILFDKTAEKNWGVPWHQDLTVAVKERREVAGFVGWSVKDGVNHVQAPREVLEQMLTVRLHLDDCGPENGPLRVLPRTHRNGWLETEAINRLKLEIPEQVCVVAKGGAVLMRPLLLHSSSRALKARHRRVLHLEFAATELPGGLRFSID
jgi:ectoine hydroxylase-related dioxygenase (phytanoyl-CoA dioxygenase family)